MQLEPHRSIRMAYSRKSLLPNKNSTQQLLANEGRKLGVRDSQPRRVELPLQEEEEAERKRTRLREGQLRGSHRVAGREKVCLKASRVQK